MWQLFWFIASVVIGELLRPKPADAPTASLGDFQFPTAEDGRSLPLAAGTVRVSGSNIVWYGDLRKRRIRESAGLFGGSVTIGAEYYLGFQAALCQGPIDALVAMEWDDKPIEYSEATVGDKLQLTFLEPNFFGGRRGEGGVSGVMDFYHGSATQAENDYLLSVLPETELPGYRNVCMAISRQMYLGNTKYPKHPAWILRHCPNSLGMSGGRHIIGGRSANPAAFIYWLLTDVNVGVQIPEAEIDLDNFRAVGDTLHGEGFGINMLYDQGAVAGEIVDDILRHVDGFRYLDPQTGLLCLGLVRNDYDPEALPVFDASNIISADIDEPSWADQVNYITVEYLDQDFKKRAVPYPNLAAIERRGEIEARTFQYLGIDSEDMALGIAARLSKRFAFPLKGGRMVVNRQGWSLHEGSVFLWDGFPMEIPARVMRVVDVDYGSLNDGQITLEVVEDIFSVDHIAYLAPSSEWDDPRGGPFPVAAQRMLEVPYPMVPGADDQLLWVLPVRGSGVDIAFEVWTNRAGAGWVLTNVGEVFAPSGLLAADYDPSYGTDVTGFTLTAGTDLQDLESVTEDEFRRGLSLVLIGDELFAWRDVTDNLDGTFTFSRVVRAVHDTVPRPHLASDRAYFFTGRMLTDPLAVVGSVSVQVRILTDNGSAVLAFGSATTMSLTTGARAARPYPPGNFRVDGSFDPGTVVGDAPVTWADRNRLTQFDEGEIVEQDDAGAYSPEGDTQLQFWIEGSVRRTENVAGTSFTYTEAMRSADYAADLDAEVEVRGYGRNAGGQLSHFYQRIIFEQVVSS